MEWRKIPEKALDKAIESLIGRVVTSLLSVLTVGLSASLVSGGFRYLIESHRVPGWLSVVGLSAVVILLVQVLAQRRRIRELSPKTPQYNDEAYRFTDLEWILTPQFFLSYAGVMFRRLSNG